VVSSSGTAAVSADMKQLEAEEEERRNFEEERFVRLTVSRKDKQKAKKRMREASTLDALAVTDIGDVGEFESLAKLTKSSRAIEGQMEDETGTADISGNSATALRRAVSAFTASHGNGSSGTSTGTKNKKDKIRNEEEEFGDIDMTGDYDDDDAGFGAMLAAHDNIKSASGNRQRRRAPESDKNNNEDNDEEEGFDLLETVSRKKKEFQSLKKQHYVPEPQYGGLQDEALDGKRAASMEIMNNRGLTPHRRKDFKNPRVKKRTMYAKAVVARKGQVREVITGVAGSYGGEMTGIKASVGRSRKIGN